MATDRIKPIIDAAERVAAGIRDDAEMQARRYVEDAKRRAGELTSDRLNLISETSDSLLEQARNVKAQSEELLHALQDAAAKITAAASEVSGNAEPARPTGALDPPAPPTAPEEERPSAGSSDAGWSPEADYPPPEPVRSGASPNGEPWLLATRMAVAGAGRNEIEARLREVGVEDPGPILDGVLNDA